LPGSDLLRDEGAGRDGDEVGLDGDGLLEGEPLLRSLRHQFSISAQTNGKQLDRLYIFKAPSVEMKKKGHE
jgi:hypothetical protein